MLQKAQSTADASAHLGMQGMSAPTLSDMDLLMETAKRILGIKNEVEVAVELMRHARR